MDNNQYIEFRENCISKVKEHPCYSTEAHNKFGRIHVPVAADCNIQCNYCVRKYDCSNENRPGVTTRVISPEEAMEIIAESVEKEPRIRVLGIAGPGDPLANDETMETFMQAREKFPYLSRCMSTNGLALPDRIEELDRAGVTSLTITINAIDPTIGRKIYSFVKYRGKTYLGRKAFEVLSHNQLEGLKEAVKRGMVVKVNSVLIPGINDTHLLEVAKKVRELGAYTMNVMPLISLGKFKDIPAPTPEELNRVRDQCEIVIKQFRSCIQCRADAIGVPGEEGCSSNILETDPLLNLPKEAKNVI